MYTNHMANKEDRIKALQTLVNIYYDDEGNRTNLPISFNIIETHVKELRELGKRPAWINACNEWLNVITHARQTFNNYMDPDNKDDTNYSAFTEQDFTTTTATEYTRLAQWAMLQGTTYLSPEA